MEKEAQVDRFIVTMPNAGTFETKPPVIVNGKNIAYTLNEVIELTADAAEAIRNCDSLELDAVAPGPFPSKDAEPVDEDEGQEPDSQSPADDAAEGDGAASPDGGVGADGGTATDEGKGDDDFDAAAVLEGALGVVTPRIEALTSLEQIEAVRGVGDERDGVAKALAKREAELSEAG